MRAGSVRLLSAFLVLLATFGTASASGFLVPGVGVRAGGLGGAFIGAADDASAAYWNPAGITQLEGATVTLLGQDAVTLGSREGTLFYRGALSAGTPVFAPLEATSAADHRLIPGVFLYPKFSLGGLFDKVGLAAYTLADYGVSWPGDRVYDDLLNEYPTTPNDPAGHRRVMGEAPDNSSRITAYAVGPVLAKEIIPGLSLGISAHAVYTTIETKVGSWYEVSYEDSAHLHPIQLEDSASGWSYCATAGVLFKATNALSVGAVLRTPMTAPLEGEVEVRSTASEYAVPKQDESYDMPYPMWAGLGFAYRGVLVEGLTLTGDLAWTQWSELDEIVRETAQELPGGNTATLNWEDTIEVGVGLDYRMSRSLSLRMGYRNVPSPAGEEHYTFVLPQITKSVLGLGATYRREAWRVDLSIEYQAGSELDIPRQVNYDMSGKHFEDVLVAGLALTYAF